MKLSKWPLRVCSQGRTKLPLTYAQELYEDTLISDLDTQLPNSTAILFKQLPMRMRPSLPRGSGPRSIDRKIKALDIDWNLYDLVKSSSNYPALQNRSAACSKWRTTCLSVASSLLACFSPFSPRLVAQCPSQRSGYLASSGTLQGADCRAIRGRIGHDFHPSLPPLPMELQDFLPKQSEIRYSRT